MLDATHTLGQVPALGTSRASRKKPGEYRFYFAIVFAVALPIALCGRLFPRALSGVAEKADPARSVVAEARALTDTVIPYLFMG
ncbi:MAG: cytochrome PufQ [Pikeienuella sp.]